MVFWFRGQRKNRMVNLVQASASSPNALPAMSAGNKMGLFDCDKKRSRHCGKLFGSERSCCDLGRDNLVCKVL